MVEKWVRAQELQYADFCRYTEQLQVQGNNEYNNELFCEVPSGPKSYGVC